MHTFTISRKIRKNVFRVDRAYVSMAHTAEVYIGLLQVGAASLFSDIEHNNKHNSSRRIFHSYFLPFSFCAVLE